MYYLSFVLQKSAHCETCSLNYRQYCSSSLASVLITMGSESLVFSKAFQNPSSSHARFCNWKLISFPEGSDAASFALRHSLYARFNPPSSRRRCRRRTTTAAALKSPSKLQQFTSAAAAAAVFRSIELCPNHDLDLEDSNLVANFTNS